MILKKEIAKFVAGAAAWDAFGHAVIAFTGLLPLKVGGFTVTPTFNAAWAIAVAVAACLLAWYAWGLESTSPSQTL